MPKKVCGFGFDCASMLMQPGLQPGECPNYATCGKATRLTPDEEIELIRVRQSRREEWRTTRRQMALEMLMQRGCPQTVEQYIPAATFEQLVGAIAQLQAQLARFEGTYIPPEGTIAHRYWVDRAYGRYPYNKLMAPSAMFAPAQEEQAVRMIHLSRDDDPRNLEARKGMTRKQRLIEIREQLQLAQTAVLNAIALAQASVESSVETEMTETDLGEDSSIINS